MRLVCVSVFFYVKEKVERDKSSNRVPTPVLISSWNTHDSSLAKLGTKRYHFICVRSDHLS